MVSPIDILDGKILIVDDQLANILLLERTLRNAGYRSITSARDPGKVCELYLLNRFDLILLDLEMPGMDGFQVMENLKEIETSGYLPVLVVTSQPSHKLRALRAGARDFLAKPLDLAEVQLRVHNLLEVRLLHQQTRTLYDRVRQEQAVSERLLLQALPQSMAERMKGRPEAMVEGGSNLISESYAEVTVLFSDLLEFTRFAEGASGDVLRGVLHDLSARFDGLSGGPARVRARTMDNAYLAAVGLDDPVALQTVKAAQKAVDLMEAMDRFNGHGRYQLKVRIGTDTPEGKGRLSGRRQGIFDL